MNRTALGLVAAWWITSLTAAAPAAEIRIVADRPLPKAAALALTELREALAAHGDEAETATAVDGSRPTILVGLAGQSPALDAVLKPSIREQLSRPEAVATVLTVGNPMTFVLASHDDRGLSYVLRDAARAVALTPRNDPWHAKIVHTIIEQPFLKVRNVSVHLFNADCEREWFFSEEFWRFYFQRLSLSRFNRCTLTYCDQTNYLCPPYAYLVEMPEYPNIQVADCTAEQRRANREMLRRIAELADEYAIDFDLGIWMQGPVAKWAAPVQVTGLPEGMELAKYCALGLRRILEGCPSIDGIQLRMNAEAGVPEDEQTAFYRPMFQTLAALQAQQRPESPYRLELRYKGLTPETIQAALDEKLDVTVSTKFWAEHFGLPYHPTSVDSHWAADRYSFGTMLKQPRDYRVTYQLWTVGSQRLTLWGDPDYCKRFAESCTLGGGEGFEVFAPLTNKGYGNKPGAWPVIKSPEHRVGKWEQERYWAFYLCFGRLGYNPQTHREVWQREFRHRFGEAAPLVEQAYRAASRVLPLITAALLPSASEWYWWPEMDTGGHLREYSRIQTSDPAQLAAVRGWDRTPAWRWEEWDRTPQMLEEIATRKPSARTTPMFTQVDLSNAAAVIRNMWQAAEDGSHPDSNEWRITAVDMQLLAGLAEFHSQKLILAAAFASNEIRNRPYAIDAGDLPKRWRQIVDVTDGVYHDDLVFGITPDMPRSKQGHHHSGHWRDRLAEIKNDDGKPQPSEAEPLQADLGDYRNVYPDDGLRDYNPVHVPPRAIVSGRPVELKLTAAIAFNKLLQGAEPVDPQRVVVHWRPLDQTRAWRQFELARKEQLRVDWIATIPTEAVDPQFDVQYYFELIDRDGGRSLWPERRTQQPYYVVPVTASDSYRVTIQNE